MLLFILPVFFFQLFSLEIKSPLSSRDTVIPARIADITVNSSQAGFIDKPVTAVISFKAYDHENKPYSGFIPRQFIFLITGQESKSVIENIPVVFSVDRYIAWLPLPRQKKSGWYDFQITAGSSHDVKSAMLPRTFYYRDEKINLLFIIDNSGSMTDNDPGEMRYKAVKNILADPAVLTYISKIALVSFSDCGELVLDFTPVSERKKINTALECRFWLRSTNLPDGITAALRLLEKTGNDERTIAILLTDGVSTIPYKNEHQAFIQRGTPLFTIGLGRPGKTEYDQALLKKIAEETGASFYPAEKNLQLSDLYARIVREAAGSIEKIIVYGLKNTYADNELPVFKIYFREPQTPRVRIFIDGKDAELLYEQTGGFYTSGILPLSRGNHYFSAQIFNGGRERKNYQKKIIVKSKPAVFSVDRQEFSLLGVEKTRLANLFFNIKNNSRNDLIMRLDFFPLVSGEENLLAARYFSSFNNPFYLRAGKNLNKNISLLVSEQTAAGLYSGYLTIAADNDFYVYNLTAEILNYARHHGTEFIPEPEKSLLPEAVEIITSRRSYLISAIWLAAGLAVFVLYISRKKNKI
ncbi:MAG: hypothetical protein A2096_13500 [Spirochaetes bacterium GWF1_41_5]|nr:MAG: hypothetical protein A2096_13500 [Spirochaetes bacterium GWF1_41_5]HBE04698.1 hypothetical protein [Spirochaetia bacterium]